MKQKRFAVKIVNEATDPSLSLSYDGEEIYLDGRPDEGDPMGQFRFSTKSLRRLEEFLNRVIATAVLDA